ncbi:hypothetical protein MMC12_000023 [Toensbergia leucococca]|nr:hypothetical protein [Toensbergia leucococca]
MAKGDPDHRIKQWLVLMNNPSISPNKFSVPGWHISGEGELPQVLSDKVILTPPYPGNKRGAIWADTKVSQPEWTADFDFRATGPERGGGNLQIWYTKEGQAYIGTSSIYTVGKFDGLALVIDTYGGRGGSIRGFLNDGNTDYKTHHAVDSLAFGHCNYAYRNLGRPSHIQITQQGNSFEVRVDQKPCFRSNKITLPTDYYFGVSAASAETPDSFEAFKFLLTNSPSSPREEPQRSQQPPHDSDQQSQPPPPPPSQAQQGPQSLDLQNRLLTISQTLDTLTRELSNLAGTTSQQHQDIQRAQIPASQLKTMDQRLQSVEQILTAFRKESDARDYGTQFAKLQRALEHSHSSLLENIPESMGTIISTRSPRMGFFLFIVIVFQCLLAASYVIYKRRRANAPKKYL